MDAAIVLPNRCAMRDLLKTIVLACLLASCSYACDSEKTRPAQPPPAQSPGANGSGGTSRRPTQMNSNRSSSCSTWTGSPSS